VKQEENSEITEFRTLLAAIRTESALLKKAILTEEEESEESKIFNEFDQTVLVQVFSTLNHLTNYQVYGWRELFDGGDDSEDGISPV